MSSRREEKSSRAKRWCLVSLPDSLLTFTRSPTRSEFRPRSCSETHTLLVRTLSAELRPELRSDSYWSVYLLPNYDSECLRKLTLMLVLYTHDKTNWLDIINITAGTPKMWYIRLWMLTLTLDAIFERILICVLLHEKSIGVTRYLHIFTIFKCCTFCRKKYA